MKRFYRFMSLVIAIAMIAAFTGCSSGSTASTPTSQGNADSTASSSPAKEQVIKWPCIWVGTDSKAPVIAELVEEFNTANAGKIKVVIEESPNYDDYRDKIRTSVVAGSFPDFFTLDQVDMNAFIESDKLMDFTPLLEESYKAGFTPGIFDGITGSDGKTKVVPYEKAVTVFMYNKDLLKKVGYDEFPKTFDEMFVMFDKMVAAGIAPTSQMTAANAWTSQLWFSYIITAIGGPDIIEKADFSDPAWVEAAKIMQTLYSKYTTSDAVGATASVAGGHYLNGDTAILANGTWYFGRLASEGIPGLSENTSVTVIPQYTGGKGEPGSVIGATLAYFAAAKTDDKDRENAIFEWVRFLTKPENIKRLSVSSGSLFHITTDLGDEISPMLKETLALLDKAPAFINHFDATMPLTVVNEQPMALSALVTGEATPEEYIARLQTALDKS